MVKCAAILTITVKKNNPPSLLNYAWGSLPKINLPTYISILKPNKSLHETKFVFETVSGVPMKVAARFQVNIKLNRIDELPAFKNLPELTYLPFVWFDTSMEMPKGVNIFHYSEKCQIEKVCNSRVSLEKFFRGNILRPKS